MSQLTEFFGNYSSLLQQYALAEDKNSYLEGLNHQNRKFFNLILNSFSAKDDQLSIQLGLNQNGQKELEKAKVFRELKRASTTEQKQNLIENILLLNPQLRMFLQSANNQQAWGMSSNQPQPFAFGGNINQAQSFAFQKKANNVLKTEQTVQEVVRRVIQQYPLNIVKLTPYGFKNIAAESLKQVEDKLIAPMLKRQMEVIRSFKGQNLVELLQRYFSNLASSRQIGQDEQFPVEFYEIMTSQQIEVLKPKFPKLFNNFNFYQRSFKLKYETKLSQYKRIHELTFQQQEEKKLLCLQILNQLQQEKSLFSFFYIQKITEEVLLLQQVLVDSNMQRFINYLKRIRTITYEHLSSDFKLTIKDIQGKNKFIDNYLPKLTFLDSSYVNQSEIINKTITSLFRQGQPNALQKLAPYISKNHLVKEEVKVNLGKGLQKEITNVYDVLTTNELNELKTLKFLTFSPRNKKIYHTNQNVELILKSKNIKQITVKIYEVDLQKHYLSGKAQIDQSINLKFLIPKCQPKVVVVGNDDPFIQENITIELPELREELGMFVVDLQGDQISSRAVIRKGMINVQNTITLIGHQLTFYDQNGELIPELVLWRNSKKIDVHGSYTIPFATTANQQIIVVHKNYAQKETIKVVYENYSLSNDFIYNSQTFIVGNKAKIVMKPELRLFTQRVSFQRLKKTTIIATSISNLKVPSTITLQNVKFKDNEDFVLQIPIKSYVQQIALTLQVQIERIDKTIQKIKESTRIPINVQETNNNFIDLYLNKCQKGLYRLQVKGLNGEAIPQALAVFTYQQFGANHQFKQSLASDSAGIFQLGQLKQVRTLTVVVTFNRIQAARTWKINNLEQSVSYGGIPGYTIYLKQGEDLSFPLPCSLGQKDIIFYHQNSQYKIYRNCFNDLKLQERRLTASNLQQGKYTLILLRLDRRVQIQVVKGKKWIKDAIIDKENRVIELNNSKQDLVSLGEITTSLKQDHTEVDIDIVMAGEQLPRDLRMHVFGKNYIDSQLQVPKNQSARQSSVQNKHNKASKQVTFKESTYLSNKRLSDETAYVLNRRKQSMNYGTNLEKPLMFLKKTEVSSTSTEQEQLAVQLNYQKPQPDHSKPQDLLSFGDFGAYGAQQQQQQYAQYAQLQSSSGAFGSPSQFMQSNQPVTRVQNKINTHNNFISQVGYLSINSQGKAIKVPIGYSQIVVYLVTNQTLIKREYSLPSPKLKTNNQTHSKLNDKDENVGWAICREIHKLHAGKQQKINKNCLWNTVSKSNLIDYAAALRVTLPDWLSNWHTYSQKKKLQVYDKNFSHQINFFLYKNDKDFFERVVKPFLKNRINKTFVDLYLIDSSQTLSFATSYKMQSLNYFQRALLTEALVRNGRQAEATKVAQSLTLTIKPLSRTSQIFKTFFQTILTAQKAEESEPAAGFNFNNTSNASNISNVSNMMNFKNMSNMGNRSGMAFGMSNRAPPGVNAFSNFSNQISNSSNAFPNPTYQSNIYNSLSNMSNINVNPQAMFGAPQYPSPPASVPYYHPSIGTAFNANPFTFSASNNALYGAPSQQMASLGGRAQNYSTTAIIQQAQQQYKSGCTSQKIREYCQTTYSGMKNQKTFPTALLPSLFWAELASHYSQKLDQNQFLSDKFSSFTSQRDFILGTSVLLSSFNSEYQLENTEDSFLITAKSSFLIFAKEIKACPIQQSKNIVINQRFFDNDSRYAIDEEGNQSEKTIDSFVVLKPYVLQTIVTNISGSILEIQVLVDIPEGSIPLKNHNKTQIKNFSVNAYSTVTFQREFYFPGVGTFNVYPANASKNGAILCKSAAIPAITVSQKQAYVKSERLEDIMRSGTNEECFSYLKQKNIFDHVVFKSSSLIMRLRNRQFFQKCIEIFKERNYFDISIWSFSFYHKSFELIMEYLQNESNTIMKNIQLPIYQYYPYYSNRVHGYVQQNRSNFKIKELRNNYASFLAHSAFYNKSQQNQIRLVFVYYLLLQDRIKQASQIRKKASKQEVQSYQLQYDYIDCFIDVSLGADNGYLFARKISQLYLDYPVLAWRSLFTDVHKALAQSKDDDLQELPKEEQIFFSTTVVNNLSEIKIKQPAQTTISVNIYKIDLQLYFSEFPFSQIHHFSSISPQKTLQFTSNSFQVNTILKKDYLELGDVIVQTFEQRQQSLPTKISTFLWTNPELRVKLYEKEGLLKVLYNGKKCQAYCKVYANGAKGIHFYKDGYTDIASTFRYALNVDKITQFSILVLTDFGGSILKVKPPALQ